MPINKNLNQAPYFDDYDVEKQFYRVMFKPGYAVQARELTQLQTTLQNQVEQFGDNIFKEGSVVKGCNFTDLDDLQFVKMVDGGTFNPETYISKTVTESIAGQDVLLDEVYEIVGASSGLRANIVQASIGFATRPPDLNTFYVNYTNTTSTATQFIAGEQLTINLYKYKVGTTTQVLTPTTGITTINVADGISTPHVGKSFGIEAAPGIIFQKGHFIFVAAQNIIVEKYSNVPNLKSVGFTVSETLVDSLQDASLYDNANGSKNENAPGADRLKLTPTLTVLATSLAKSNSDFFTLVRYENGNAITVRDVSQYNVLGEELARRTYEESGNYILDNFPLQTDDRVPEGGGASKVNVLVGTGVAYVKGYRVENSGERAFPIDQISGTEEVENQSVSFDYGNYVDIVSFNGRIDLDNTEVTLQNQSSSNLGTAIVTNITPTKVFLSRVIMNGSNSIADLDRITDGNGYIRVGNTLHRSGQRSLIFDTGLNSLYGTNDTLVPVRVRSGAISHTSGSLTISAVAGEDFNCTNDDIVVIDSTSVQHAVTSFSLANNNSELTVNFSSSAAAQVYVYYNKRLIGSSGVDPYSKLSKTPYVQVTHAPATTKYQLGFPDVYKIISITGQTSGTDWTSSFVLRPNQKDTYYDISYMEYIEGRPQPGNENLSIQVGVFQLSNVSGEAFFTINSYPNSLDRYEIPTYVSSSGRRFNLRDCFDFRQYTNKDTAADYTNVSAPGPVLSNIPVGSNTIAFSNPPLLPALGNSITTDLEYYLTRIDTIVCDSYGELSIIKGEEDRYAVPPSVDTDQVAIAQIEIPGYPALSHKQANILRKNEYSIRPKAVGVKNYTMKDMHQLEKKIDNMQYYISLNQLESETSNMVVRDENGLSRFKNGFVVDPFNNLSLAEIADPQFKAAVPFNQKILTPAVKTFALDLTYDSSTGASVFPSASNAKVGTIGRNSNVQIIDQPYASGYRNAVSNFYKYVGEGAISPPYDAAYDTTVNPATIDIDLAGPFEDFVDAIQEIVPMTDTTTTVVTQQERWGRRMGGRRRGGGVETTTFTTRTSEINVDSTVEVSDVGEFVSNFQFEPFMAARDIKIYMAGLRPNQRHYFFFDGVNVDAHVLPGSSTANNVEDVQRTGVKAAAVSTDANGVLRAVFALPAETFYVGDRILEIADVNLYSSLDSASTSKGFVTYRAYNFSVEKTALTTSTRSPNFDVNTTVTTRNVARRLRGRDPLAQTFFVKKGMGAGSNSVYLSDIDVYFKRKPSTTDANANSNAALNGVSVQIREVINGYPTNAIIPFSVVHKLPADVNVSEDASLATKFTFEAPVRLDVEKEYSFVIQPDASDPNYLVYTAKVGGIDLTPGETQGAAITQDWGDGVLFTSTNNSAWKSYQDEDIKFALNRHNFNSSTGSISLTNNGHEFFTVNNITGRFNPGERIYQEKTPNGSTGLAVGTSVGSKLITGTALDSTYTAGDFIKVVVSGVVDIFEVVSVDSSTQLTANKPASAAASGSSQNHWPVCVGELSHYDLRNPYEIQLEESSASATRFFTTGSNIVGLDSASTANLSSIENINLSYVQPMIMRTSDSTSKTSLSGTFVPPASVGITYSTPMRFNDNNYFTQDGVVLYSKSNDPSGSKVFKLNVAFENGANVTSTPFLDIEASKLLCYQYKITNAAATTSKYISKRIELAEDLDAEDFELTLTGYRPTGTDIKAYIKPQNGYDNDDFDSVPWVELELFEGVGVYSTVSNINDYREFKYRIPATAKTGSVNSGELTYTSNSGVFIGFKRFSVRIDMLSPNIHNAPTLKDYRGIALT